MSAATSVAELEELAALWLEQHVAGKDDRNVSLAIRQVDRESRRLQRKEQVISRRAASHKG